MKNKEVAALFNEIADILEIRRDNPFRINAYRRAAQVLDGISNGVEDLATEERLHEIPGIGKDLSEKIREYLDSGAISFLQELREETPRILLDMLRVPGIGPKTAVLLYEGLGVESLDELKRAALEHRIQVLPKMKAKTEANILAGIEFLQRSSGRIPLGEAYPIAERITSSLKKMPEVKRISPAGSLRRWRETVGDIDVLVTSSAPQKVIRRFTGLEGVARVLAQGTTKGSVVTNENIQVDLRVVAEESYGAALCYFTGSKEHNIRLREIAIQKGLKLSEYGVFRKGAKGADKRIASKSEEDVYRALDLPFIPPEIREDTGEVEAAREGKLPVLVTAEHLRGDLHVHSNWSDGTASLEDLAREGRRRGYRYLLVSDHSQSLAIAHGLSAERLRRQLDEIDRINGNIKGFTLLKGSEVDILPDGSLDLNEALLKRLDVVIVAIHSRFKMPEDKMTERVIKALKHPRAHIFAHPTGRLIGSRDAYQIDMDAVIETAAETATALEINAHPVRLDLDAPTARKAASAGVKIAIGTDTHNPAIEMNYMIYGIGTARRGWLTCSDVLNTYTAQKLLSHLSKKSGTE